MDNTNKGVLFKNDKKETDKHPDYNGSININGIEHFLSAWINISKSGNKYMSLSIGKVKEQKPNQASKGYTGTDTSGSEPDFDDDIPF